MVATQTDDNIGPPMAKAMAMDPLCIVLLGNPVGSENTVAQGTALCLK